MKSQAVLKNVSFSLRDQRITGFLGVNGAGKTTLIHSMVGLRKPTQGEVLIGGQSVQLKEARKGLGYLPERPYFPEHLTAEAFLKYLGTLSDLSRAEIAKNTDLVLDRVGILHAKRRELREFSKGMLQRLGLAQAILHDPRVLILDEPMSGLDPIGRKEVRELILELGRSGHLVFFSSHVISDVEAICDDVICIHEGQIVRSGVLSEFFSQDESHESRRTEIAFQGLTEAMIQSFSRAAEIKSVTPIAEGFRLEVNSQNLVETLVVEALQKGARLLWVTPNRPSLEKWFSENLKKAPEKSGNTQVGSIQS